MTHRIYEVTLINKTERIVRYPLADTPAKAMRIALDKMPDTFDGACVLKCKPLMHLVEQHAEEKSCAA